VLLILSNRRPPLPKPGRLLKCISHLQHAEVLLIAPHNLYPDRKPLSAVKPAGTDAAGFPVIEMYQQAFIQSM
jgi:hypothetical protein